jgi:glycosyltransferase involved in cell wall biosynthesis
VTAEPALRVLLVDPSLFTGPYDAALTRGLLEAGVAPRWAIRPTRDGDRDEIPAEYADPFFYRKVDGLLGWPRRLRALAKGAAHVGGLLGLCWRVLRQRPQIVHFQWAVVPLLDAIAIWLLQRRCPVILTVHDTTPFNGERVSRWQAFASDLPLRCANRLIVHTRSGRAALLRRGLPEPAIAVIAHGPLRVNAVPSETLERSPSERRWTCVCFGELKRYKGIDVLVEAAARLPRQLQRQLCLIIAGRPRMALAPLRARIVELGLEAQIELRPHRHSEQEMADLFAHADCFLFPYRQVDASGVYFLIKSCAKWIIASRVGVFAEDLQQGVQGALVPPEDVGALAQALAYAIEHEPRPAPASSGAAWSAIARQTRELYCSALLARAEQMRRGARRAWLIASAVTCVSLAVAWLSQSVLAARVDVTRVPEPIETATLPAAPLGIPPEAGYRLLKNWDFRRLIRDLSQLRSEFHTRYVYANGTLDHLNDEWSRYREQDNHEFTAEGLSLVARARSALAPGEIESGMLRSRWSGRYGVFEIRMRVPSGRGLWPAFWLNPEDQRWPPEIDVTEIVDNGRDSTRSSFHFLHGGGDAAARFSRLNRQHAYEPGIDYSDAYHVFAVEWTPERVRHLVDGKLVVDREYQWRHDDGSDAGPAHVLVNLAVGGKWPGAPVASSLPARLRLEYIRVWQR